MKKSDIINEYNSLTQILLDYLEEYKRVTGKEWEGCVKTGRMAPAMMNIYKDELERELCRRKHTIHSIRRGIENWKRTEDLKSTEEGRMFIKNLEDEMMSLEKKIEEIGEELSVSFEGCLMKAGMRDWKVSRKNKIIPENSYVYFEIEKEDMKYASLNICVDLQNSRGMEVSSSIHCGGRKNISDFDENYWQFKGYTLIHENHEVFNHWMDKDFRAANIDVRNIRDRIEKIETILKDPMTEYEKMSK